MLVDKNVESPCISVCKIDEKTRYCIGCWRTAAEIQGWSFSNDLDRASVIEKCHQRMINAGLKGPRKNKRYR